MPKRTQPETPAGGPLGDTGDGNTGVPDDEQGISNRPGDRAEDDVDVDVKYDDIESTASASEFQDDDVDAGLEVQEDDGDLEDDTAGDGGEPNPGR
jgi:hypothetical protein